MVSHQCTSSSINLFSNLARDVCSRINGIVASKERFLVIEELFDRASENVECSILVRSLEDYCDHERQENTAVTLDFVKLAVLRVCQKRPRRHFDMVYRLVYLLGKYGSTYQDAFRELLGPVKLDQNANSVSLGLLGKFEYFLRRTREVDVVTENGRSVRLIDAPMAFGETALVSSAKHRHPETVLLLLRYGADPAAKWLSFNSTLECALFSPNKSSVTEEDRTNTHTILLHFARAQARIDVRRLEQLSKEGYYAVLPEWRDQLPKDRYCCPCSLKDHCKFTIRAILSQNRGLPVYIYRLPVPEKLKYFIDLQL